MSRKTSRRDVKTPGTLGSLGSFKVSACVSEAATSRLGLVSDKILNVSVSETWVSGLVSVSAQKVSCTFVIIMHQNISSVLLISRMTSRNLDVLGYVKSFTVKTNEKMHSRSSRSGCWGAYTIFSFWPMRNIGFSFVRICLHDAKRFSASALSPLEFCSMGHPKPSNIDSFSRAR